MSPKGSAPPKFDFFLACIVFRAQKIFSYTSSQDTTQGNGHQQPASPGRTNSVSGHTFSSPRVQGHSGVDPHSVMTLLLLRHWRCSELASSCSFLLIYSPVNITNVARGDSHGKAYEVPLSKGAETLLQVWYLSALSPSIEQPFRFHSLTPYDPISLLCG